MCTVDHTKFPNYGYAFDLSMESIAPDWVFTRMLGHHRDVGLSPEQIMALLDLSAEYHARSLEIKLEVAEIREKVEIRDWVDDAKLNSAEALIRRHAELFEEHEMLFFEYARRGQEILTEEQKASALRVYRREEQQTFGVLGPIAERALDTVATHTEQLEREDQRLVKTG